MQNVSNPKIEFSTRFDKKLRNLPSEIIDAFKETLELFLEDPKHESLRRHMLKEKYAGYESVDVTLDYRALFTVKESKGRIVIKFYIIGNHEELYGKQ